VTVLENRWIPQQVKDGLTPKQAEFLCFDGREALYGGAAGGGKSVALLAAALQYIDEPGYSALILRRTHKQLAKSDSILSKAKEWLLPLRSFGLRWSEADHKFTFPGGQTLEFGHMEHENSKTDYQGGAWSFIGVDEATQFTQTMISYPRSRQRRPTGSRIPIRWRGGSNPGGIGHDHIKARYIRDKFGKDPSGPNRQFFPATLEDNPHIDRDEYVATLKESGIDDLTLAQLLRGDWDAVPGGRFKRDWFRYYHRQGDYAVLSHGGQERRVKPAELPRFFTIDTASSTSTAADYTVISVWAQAGADLLWLDCIRDKWEIPDIVPQIQKAWIRYRPQYARIEAIYGNRAVLQLAQRASNPVMIIRSGQPRAGQGGSTVDKLVHATAAISFAASGRLWLPADNPLFPLSDVEGELVRFTGDEKQDANDDIVDTLSYAVRDITAGPSERQARQSGEVDEMTMQAEMPWKIEVAKGYRGRSDVPWAVYPTGYRRVATAEEVQIWSHVTELLVRVESAESTLEQLGVAVVQQAVAAEVAQDWAATADSQAVAAADAPGWTFSDTPAEAGKAEEPARGQRRKVRS
jgi:phage terminase large subunit-like protein